jgi:hypothetical protein
MRELQEDGAAPAGNDDDLAIDFPADAAWPGAMETEACQARADRGPVPVEQGAIRGNHP